MKKALKMYIQAVEQQLIFSHSPEEWRELVNHHLIKIQFFQHERLIHFLVTGLFALLFCVTFIAGIVFCEAGILVLSASLLILLIPYIGHYFFLENHVQYLYQLYDQLRGKIR